jgi:hypothetical protein
MGAPRGVQQPAAVGKHRARRSDALTQQAHLAKASRALASAKLLLESGVSIDLFAA